MCGGYTHSQHMGGCSGSGGLEHGLHSPFFNLLLFSMKMAAWKDSRQEVPETVARNFLSIF